MNKKSTVDKASAKEALIGTKLYQQRSRKAFPILVRQAKAEQPIIYSDLAKELNMPNPRNLDYVLGAIGHALFELGKEWNQDIPPIQSLVINKHTLRPGKGFEGFLQDKNTFKKSSTKRKRFIIRQLHDSVFQYGHWDEILKYFNLKSIDVKWAKLPITKETLKYGKYGKGGESIEHKRLKKYISENPQLISISDKVSIGKVEYELPSSDIVDILFKDGNKLIGVEVKSIKSNAYDIARGIYQCVKYRALIEAVQMVSQEKPNSRTILVIEGTLPQDLLGLKNTLGIEVIEIQPMK